jgi:autotransporter-associated beta strand protein
MTLYVFDNNGENNDLGNANNYLDSVAHTRGVLPGSSDSVQASGQIFHGTVSIASWQGGTLTSGEITTQTAANMTISGGTLKGFDLHISGAGPVSVDSGGSAIAASRFIINVDGTLLVHGTGSLSSLFWMTANGLFDISGSDGVSIPGLDGAGHVRLGGQTLTVAGGAAAAFSGVIEGTGGLAKTGSGVLILEGANTYTGATHVTGGTLWLRGNGVLTHSIGVTVDHGANLTGNLTFLGAASNTFVNNGGASGNIHLGLGSDNFVGIGGTSSHVFGDAGNDGLAGGLSFDSFDGGAGNDVLKGGGGADTLLGGAGNDTLSGGAGFDLLTGGAGTDRLAGGLGVDWFIFLRPSDSARGAGHDVISDFNRAQHDVIDLHAIDADTSANPGNDFFKFIGSEAFHGGGGELRFSNHLIQGDVNGDRIADIEIQVNLAVMKAGDFLL